MGWYASGSHEYGQRPIGRRHDFDFLQATASLTSTLKKSVRSSGRWRDIDIQRGNIARSSQKCESIDRIEISVHGTHDDWTCGTFCIWFTSTNTFVKYSGIRRRYDWKIAAHCQVASGTIIWYLPVSVYLRSNRVPGILLLYCLGTAANNSKIRTWQQKVIH